MTDKIVVLVTCASAKEAGRIAGKLVEKRLAACASILQAPVESIYRWRGKMERAKEYLLVVKTTSRRFTEMREEILRLHNYDVPEIIALPIANGLPAYLAWIAESVRPAVPNA